MGAKRKHSTITEPSSNSKDSQAAETNLNTTSPRRSMRKSPRTVAGQGAETSETPGTRQSGMKPRSLEQAF
ncbi:hypothetical protein OS493_024056 [Desmophyllum pertusum]|uniref:Uncharacterized protein n=1 Tax=Desmophyllum pertusum TaxID=174260 RepID=A0A9X0D1T8_9CNID|nr:hypothetical protein OS493_024056 [Desmophyllum pertusum]